MAISRGVFEKYAIDASTPINIILNFLKNGKERAFQFNELESETGLAPSTISLVLKRLAQEKKTEKKIYHGTNYYAINLEYLKHMYHDKN